MPVQLGQIGQVPNNTVLRGTIKNSLVPGITTSTWNPRSGGLSKTVFTGTQSQITELARDAKTNGWEYSIAGGEVFTLEVTFPYDIIVDNSESESNPLFIWELLNTSYEKDILEVADRPFNQNLSKDTIAAIENKLKNPQSTNPPYTIIDANDGKAAVNATVAYNLKAINLRGQGSTQTLRRTIIVGNTYNASPYLFPGDDYKIYLKKDLLNKYSNSANILNDVPDSIQKAMPETLSVMDFNSDTPHNLQGYTMDRKGIVTYIGWLQFPPEYSMVSTNKIQITQNWSFNQFSAGPWGLFDPVETNVPSPNPNDILHLIS